MRRAIHPLRVVAHIMRLAIDLDAQRGARTIEIQRIWSDRVLFPEPVISRTLAQNRPQQDLRQAHLATKPPRS
jgi:hypothetical protein